MNERSREKIAGVLCCMEKQLVIKIKKCLPTTSIVPADFQEWKTG